MKSFWKQYNRPILCLVLVVVIMLSFVLRLFNWQVVVGDYYRDEVATTANYRLTSDETRGEILDVNGVALETNTTAYSVTINKLYISQEMTVNDVIMELFIIFQERNTPWIDPLPIVVDESNKYQFDYSNENAESTLESMRSEEMLDLGVYATATDFMDAFVERYELEDYAHLPDLCRNLVSVRYNMEMTAFSNTNPYTFAEDIDTELSTIIAEFSQSMPCIEIVPVSKRLCTDGTLMPHILGVTGSLTAEEYEENKDKGYAYDDIIGKFGIEAAFEDYLKGEPGTKTISKNSDGTLINVVELEPAKPGNSIFLTIDSNLQRATNASLARYVQDAQAAGKAESQQKGEKGHGEDCIAGAAVMLSVKDFSVLAASTYPTYDLTQYSNGDYYASLLEDETLPLYDRAFLGSFAPGSVVKPATALGALEEGIISDYDTITCTQKYDYYPTNIVHCMGTHGPLTVTAAITKSCNYFFADMGRQLGIDTMSLYMEKLGLGEKTGLEISESQGFLAGRDSTSWVAGNTVQAAIGQSDNTFTPVQLATFAATIANDGVRYRTHLVSKITSYDRQEIVLHNDPEKPQVVEDLQLTPYNVDIVQNAMRQVAADPSGTAHSIFGDYSIPIACKTGTAENPGSDHVTFICYAPYDDPQVALAVVLEHGAKGKFSMSVARDMLNAYFFPETIEQTIRENTGVPEPTGPDATSAPATTAPVQ